MIAFPNVPGPRKAAAADFLAETGPGTPTPTGTAGVAGVDPAPEGRTSEAGSSSDSAKAHGIRTGRTTATPSPGELEDLGDEIARLSAHLHAATYRLLVLIRAFDERGSLGACRRDGR